MELDSIVNKIITAAYIEAKYQKHEYITPEHILYSSLFFDESKEIIVNCGGNIEDIKNDLINYFDKNLETIEKTEDIEPIESMGFNNTIQSAVLHGMSAQKDSVKIGDVIAAIYNEPQSFASYILQKNGIRKIDILRFVSHQALVMPKNHDGDEQVFEMEEELNERIPEKKEFLDYFTVELVEKARKGETDPLIGRGDVLQRTIQVLSRRIKNNPVHIGDPGVGKTAITEGLAKLIVDNKVPKTLQGSKIYYLDMGSLIAGTRYRGDFEERIKKVLNEIEKKEKAIVYIDEIHTIVGAGAIAGSAMDASNILKPFLTSSKLRFIGSTTIEEYKKYFEKDRALSRRFQRIDVSETTIEETYLILEGLKERYERFHDVKYTVNSLRLACELSAKYINDRHLPDKAIDVIDETGAYVRLQADRDDGIILVTEKDVERTVSLIAKIPEQSVSNSEIDNLKNLDKLIKKEIFGQDQAIEAVVQAIKRSRAGFNEGEKPVASILFVGPTGVGKTEIAKQLSTILGVPLIRFDMSEYQEKHTVARLIGSPPGYVGYEEGGLLTEAIRKTPYCVLLLDEVEKSHPDILNVLLQVMDYATLTDNSGKKADFRNVILIMTSNAGAREVGKTMIGFENRKIDRGVICKEVERIFSPEFRNRLDNMILFNHINEDMALQIAKKVIRQFEEKLKVRNVKIEVSDNCYKWLAEKGVHSIYGAREILRVVQEKIKTYFVDEVLFGELSKGGKAEIDINEDEIQISMEE